VRAVAVVLGLLVAAFVLGTASYVLVERRFLQPSSPPPAAPAVIDLRDDRPRDLVEATSSRR
jgi:hypothetical protein